MTDVEYVCVSQDHRPDKVGRKRIYCVAADATSGQRLSILQTVGKLIYRFFEFVASFIALILSLPALLVIYIIVALDSPGRAFFVQTRLSKSVLCRGQDIADSGCCTIDDPGFAPEKLYWIPQVFPFIKFRTMYADAKERFPELYSYQYTEEEIRIFAFKVPNDPRVTRAGKWLRESTLDELPNFISVLNGNIRLVGPRPEIPEMLAYYTPEQMLKFSVKPGITGLPQIKGRGRLSFEQTKTFDLEYVRIQSVLQDLKIIFVTIWKVITRHGAF